ncbi:MAG TPA: hypothetical protein VIM61_02340 [Chthoniobacterales bacterium]
MTLVDEVDERFADLLRSRFVLESGSEPILEKLHELSLRADLEFRPSRQGDFDRDFDFHSLVFFEWPGGVSTGEAEFSPGSLREGHPSLPELSPKPSDFGNGDGYASPPPLVCHPIL